MCLNGCGRSGDVELGSGQGRLQHHTDPPQSCLQRALSCKQGSRTTYCGILRTGTYNQISYH